MAHFIIYTNENKDHDLEMTGRIRSLLEAGGGLVTCLVTKEEQRQKLPTLTGDVMITLGGDGTILQAVRDLAGRQMPLVGVNMGHLGFLTETGPEGIDDLVRKLLASEYTIDRRMMLEGALLEHEEQQAGKTALNDIVLSRSGSLEILRFQVYVNGEFFHEYLADGIILSTPTGSTGYNLSAGGPLIEPNASMITLTPICPHSLNQRSILLSSEDEIEFRIPLSKDGNEQSIEAYFDGQEKIKLHSGSILQVKRSSKTTDVIRVNQDSFLEVLNRKLGENL